MPRTPEQLRRAAEDAERWIDSLDPAAIADPDADASDLREIGRAVIDAAEAEERKTRAVLAARDNGRTWSEIGMMLGISRQSAQEKYGRLVEGRAKLR